MMNVYLVLEYNFYLFLYRSNEIFYGDGGYTMPAISLASALVAATVLGSVATPPSALAKARLGGAQTDQTRADDLWNKQYCEIFLGYAYAAKMSFKIFNTIGFNYCPTDKVSTFNTEKLK